MNIKVKRIIFLLIIICLIITIILIIGKKDKMLDTLNYDNKTYVYLEINTDVFNYEFNSNKYYEIEMIHKVDHDKWDMIYFEGDLFIYERELKKAQKYYSNDDNYEWTVIVEENEVEEEYPIFISDNELEYLYNIENIKKEETMLFDEIQKFGTIKKVSKDKTIYSTICLAYFNDYWYYRTFTIDVNKENDPEYVIKLPETLNKKINNLILRSSKNN